MLPVPRCRALGSGAGRIVCADGQRLRFADPATWEVEDDEVVLEHGAAFVGPQRTALAVSAPHHSVVLVEHDGAHVKTTVPVRFTLPVTTVTFGPDAVCIGTADGKVVTADAHGGSTVDYKMNAPCGVRGVAVSEALVAAAMNSGDLVVWLRSKPGKAVYEETTLRTCAARSGGAPAPFQMAWRPQGDVLLLPGFAQLYVFDAAKAETSKLKCADGTPPDTELCAWAPDGQFCAVSAGSSVHVFSWADRTLVQTISTGAPVQSLCFLAEREIAAGGPEGVRKFAVEPSAKKLTRKARPQTLAEKRPDLYAEDDEDERSPHREGHAEDAAAEAAEAAELAEMRAELADLEDKPEEEEEAVEEEADVDVEDEEPEAPDPLQDAFQPGVSAEHVEESGRTSRFLCMNRFGRLVANVSADGVAKVEVKLTSTMTGRTFHVTNVLHCTMGALSEAGVVLGKPMDAKPACIVGRLVTSLQWSATQWVWDLPDGEDLVALAMGSVCAVATTRYLRLFSASGVQIEAPEVLPGRVVALAMHDAVLLVVYHLGGAVADWREQRLGYELHVLGKDRRLLDSGLVPLSPTSWPRGSDFDEEQASLRPPMTSLQYAGFSDEAVPLVMDSHGLLFGLLPVGSSLLRWLPLLDFKAAPLTRGRAAPYVVSCSDKEVSLLMPKDGSDRLAAVTPDPQCSVKKVALSLPMLDLTESTQRQQEVLLRTRTMRRHAYFAQQHGLPAQSLKFVLPGASLGAVTSKAEAEHEKTLVTLFAEMVQSEQLDRALDVARLALLPRTRAMCMTVAEKLQHRALADAIQALEPAAKEPEPPTPAAKRPRVSEVPSVEKVARREAPAPTHAAKNPFAVAVDVPAPQPLERVLEGR